MDMSKFRPESHVAQQSLRDNLRVPQAADFPNSINPDLIQVRSDRNDHLLFDPDVFSSGIFHGSSSSNVFTAQSGAILHLELQTAQEHRQMLDEESSLSGYASGLAGSESNQDPWFVGEVMSNNARASSISAATQYLKPSYGNLQFVSPSLYQNSQLGFLSTASIGTQELEVASHERQSVREAEQGSRMDFCGNQANPLPCGDAGAWMNRPLVEHSQQWCGEMEYLACKRSVDVRAAASDTATTQGLVLSLSSNPTSKICGADAVQFTEDEYGYDGFHSRPGELKELQDSKTLNMGNFCSMQKPFLAGKANGKSLHDAGGISTHYVHRQTIPIGPFTGYATILENSRFLMPAQALLDEFCHVTKSNPSKVCDTSEGASRDAIGSGSAGAPNKVDMEAGTSKGNNLGASSSTFYCSNESCRPDQYQQKKAKLAYMQEEVCRRYKLYHQQMQMVVSSFESVVGLGAASPYFSLALKTVAKKFRCLRNAILGQIRHISRALGEDLLSPTTGTSSSKGDINMSRLKYAGQNSGGVNMGLLEPQQHGWRPQRGLPERSVAILRAWLFEHFLHPYPTDTDKHILAIQTGLSRNQVSNWFINARVRVWKPMVEEIHMLESKGLAEGNQNLSKSDGKYTSEGCTIRPNEDQSINTSVKQVACSDIRVADIAGDAHDVQLWNHEKRSRIDFDITTNMEGPLMGVPFEQNRLENVGLGAVSLTLGLRHGVESAQQQQQQYQQQEHHLRRQFGGQLIHDFAG
ncbi:BEL1-like homeodomain protein 4 [Hibiscus syriacus]|uniref:BEL1-like homeodomain protein 4 n=1 Tax=Hibiscus syriacus TaxID=106335 RepID=UPI001921153B|nr:BEL1-like homeodomain protein 4 [Hibiscus syriacus]